MRLTVVGSSAGWPTPDNPSSCYLLAAGGMNVLLDVGYAAFPALSRMLAPESVDAVLVTHGHPDHVADLHPLLRARGLRGLHPPPLQVYALPGAIDAVLALDGPGHADGACRVSLINPGQPFSVGPLTVISQSLPHFVPNVGFRLTNRDGSVLAYTGDAGPHPSAPDLFRGADLLLAEATFAESLPAGWDDLLSTAEDAARLAAASGAGALALTHLWPDSDPEVHVQAARRHFAGPVYVARPGLSFQVAGRNLTLS
jgi:ribonuclease BN (tRNA processing enzyme)